ncbi:MAG: FtsX-like permease family protein [Pelagibacteraceae bacterium]|jgi:lipoprotein-releasing system permease protein|nr:FtsX-like permease family protein [Pelagibacteraceae bacterium]MBT4645231.1 FtsX-like permease family protein [Pelagibacteraceae bacterium]MBT4951203.1 FtsX-like permease family protein [Pelagibacteraceae bacterium]MBT5213868.1 FtsX-like permease family protein [Pelagibacteraceae bacterium]MBT6354159.1 FtsX-like permease family protein [Pelagibacteraceae bacterium]
MFSKAEILIIKRFLFSKKTEGYVSVFSWFSIIGIALGVAAIIIVMSVMNGFRSNLTERLIGVNSHLNIYSFNDEIKEEQIEEMKNKLNIKKYKKVFSSVETQGLIIKDNTSNGVIIRGYKEINFDHYLYDKIITKKISSIRFNKIIIGDALANKLNLKIGDKLKIAVPKTDKSLLGNIPRFKTLIIDGIFDFGMYEYDSNLVFISIDLARKLLLIENNIFNRVEFYIENPLLVGIFKDSIDQYITNNSLDLYSLSWIDRNSSLMNALKVEKNVMFLILTLIIIVASMNIISGLIIFVKEKNKDIGILKTLGFNNFSILKIFCVIGFVIGLIGSISGTIIGIMITENLNYIQAILENLLDTQLFSEEVYFLSTLPSDIKYQEVLFVFLISITITILSTIFPAIRASNIDPIDTLKNE